MRDYLKAHKARLLKTEAWLSGNSSHIAPIWTLQTWHHNNSGMQPTSKRGLRPCKKKWMNSSGVRFLLLPRLPSRHLQGRRTGGGRGSSSPRPAERWPRLKGQDGRRGEERRQRPSSRWKRQELGEVLPTGGHSQRRWRRDGRSWGGRASRGCSSGISTSVGGSPTPARIERLPD